MSRSDATMGELLNSKGPVRFAAIVVAVFAGAASHFGEGSLGAADAPVRLERAAVWRAIFARPRVGAEALPSDSLAKIELGHDLFRDPRLSGEGATSCASCHDPARAFTDGRSTGLGPTGTGLVRNVPTLYNLAWASSLFWDGRVSTLAEQARVPIQSKDEMSGDFATIADRLERDPAIKARFRAAYPASPAITEADIIDALTAYERTLVSPATRFDRWVEGEDAALDATEQLGFEIFTNKGGCVTCHGGWRLTDDGFHDIGLAGDDLGRGALDGTAKGLPQFKTPSLRELTRTAPYMHDGSLATLEDVVEHYAGKHLKRPSLAATLVRDLTLAAEEKAALVAFLKSLSSGPREAETSRPVPDK